MELLQWHPKLSLTKHVILSKDLNAVINDTDHCMLSQTTVSLPTGYKSSLTLQG
jgi:hypothetical protein